MRKFILIKNEELIENEKKFNEKFNNLLIITETTMEPCPDLVEDEESFTLWVGKDPKEVIKY